MAEIAEGLSGKQMPKVRQRVFAAHAHDMQLLLQMSHVLFKRAASSPDTDGGIQTAGLIEEGQLYAATLQELAKRRMLERTLPGYQWHSRKAIL